MTKKEVQKGH